MIKKLVMTSLVVAVSMTAATIGAKAETDHMMMKKRMMMKRHMMHKSMHKSMMHKSM